MLSLGRDGVAVATIPRRGSQGEAERFVEMHRDWLMRARERQRRRPRAADVWTVGTPVLWRGNLLAIRPVPGPRPSVCLGSDVFRVPALEGDLRPALQGRFIRLAKAELPARAWELAAQTRMNLTRVSVRDQRSRWGSCTAAGVVSLNWRLIMAPEAVRDYIILHELMHLREMNHSPRFWACVEEVFPGWRAAEAWIKRNGGHAGL
jgi:predicted metal-dependent hydrolase